MFIDEVKSRLPLQPEWPGAQKILRARSRLRGSVVPLEYRIELISSNPVQSPRGCHNQIAVTERHMVDKRVVVRGSEVWKCSAEHQDHCPQGDLDQVRGRGICVIVLPEAPYPVTAQDLSEKIYETATLTG
jgi:hypothetical protein